MTWQKRRDELANSELTYENGTPVFDKRTMEYRRFIKGYNAGRLAGLEEAAVICEKTWRDAPNSRTDGFKQNEISHGCLESASEIRKEIEKLIEI